MPKLAGNDGEATVKPAVAEMVGPKLDKGVRRVNLYSAATVAPAAKNEAANMVESRAVETNLVIIEFSLFVTEKGSFPGGVRPATGLGPNSAAGVLNPRMKKFAISKMELEGYFSNRRGMSSTRLQGGVR